MNTIKCTFQTIAMLCCVALSACESNKQPQNLTLHADSFHLSVDEKSDVVLQAAGPADSYWLSHAGLPDGWNIPSAKQNTPKFEFRVGPAESNTLLKLKLHQTTASTGKHEVTPVEIKVRAIEEKPTAVGETFTLSKGIQVTHANLPVTDRSNLLLNDRDEPEDTAPSAGLKITLVSAPKHAESFELGARGGWSYRANEKLLATHDSFSYVVSDGNLDSDPVTVTLKLLDNDFNSPPTAHDAYHVVPHPDDGYKGNLSVQVYDPDDSILNYRVTRAPKFGSLELDLDTGSFCYLPASDKQGYLDSFDYEVLDLLGASASATFTMELGDPPDISFQALSTLSIEPSLHESREPIESQAYGS